MNDAVVRDWINGHSLLRETEEEFAAAFRSPPIEAERELIQIVVEVLLTDRTLVGPHEPPFEEGDHQVDPGH